MNSLVSFFLEGVLRTKYLISCIVERNGFKTNLDYNADLNYTQPSQLCIHIVDYNS